MSLDVGNQVVIEGCERYPYLNGHQGVIAGIYGDVIAVNFGEWNVDGLGHDCCGLLASCGYYVPTLCCRLTSEAINSAPQTDTEPDPDALRVFNWLSAHNWKPTEGAVQSIVDEWRNKKARLAKLFSAHPNYVQGQNKIVFSRDEERTIDGMVVNDTFRNLMNFLYKNADEDGRDYIDAVIGCFRYINSQFIDEESATDMSNKFNIKISSGIKTSKAMNRILSAKGFDKYNDQPVNEQGEVDKQAPTYNKLFAKYADALNPIVVRRFTVISFDILDFLTMSHGTGWKSCHMLSAPYESGGWSSGTLSYALDDVSMILYTVDGGFSGEEFWREPKISRQIFCLNEENTLLQSRLYPASGNQTQIDDYRNLVQRTISECLDIPNRWTMRTVDIYADSGNAIIHKQGATNYPDYFHTSGSAGNYSTYLSKPRDVEYSTIEVGSLPICIECGDRHRVSGSILCNACRNELQGLPRSRGLFEYNLVVCAECGCILMERQTCLSNNQYFCSNCGYQCSSCGEFLLGNPYGYDTDENPICEDCADEEYYFCGDCEHYIRGDAVFIDRLGCYLCDECLFDRGYHYCENCGELIPPDYGECYGDYIYCSDCFNGEFCYCVSCDEVIRYSDAYRDDDGECYCEVCYNDRYSHCSLCDTETECDKLIEIDTGYTEMVCRECAFSYAETQNVDCIVVPSSQTAVFAQLHRLFNYLGHEPLLTYLINSGSISQYIVDSDNDREFLVVNGSVITRGDE